MEWLGALFKGIGDTFTAGSQAHQALIGERNLRQQLAFNREALEAGQTSGMLSFLLSKRQQEANIVMIVVATIMLLLIVIFIFRKRSK